MAKEQIEQAGFDFWAADDITPIEKPAGTWESRLSLTKAQWLARFALAEAAILGLAGPGRPVFQILLDQERDAFAAQLERMVYAPEGEFCLWGAQHRVDDELIEAFWVHCKTHMAATYGGVVYKARLDSKIPAVGMHVEGLGSVVARDWRQHGRGVSFSLVDLDAFFLDSYDDGAARYELPYSIWGSSMACQRLSESGDAVCNVSTFQHLGRDFFVSSISHCGDNREGSAWSVVPACDWKGKTYTYRSQIKAYDAGILERGDHRGLLVKIRGALCVVDGFAAIFCRGEDAGDFVVGAPDEGADLDLFVDDEVEDAE